MAWSCCTLRASSAAGFPRTFAGPSRTGSRQGCNRQDDMESTQRAYSQAIQSLSLSDLYKEQDRLSLNTEKWSRMPRGRNQVEIHCDRIEILEKEIEARYQTEALIL